jgi:hypothetical protein
MILVTALEGARRAGIEGDELYVEFTPESRHLRDTLAKTDNVKLLRDACQQAIGKELGVRIVVKDKETVDAPTSRDEEERREKQSLREAAEESPLVQQMLRTFRGEIVDARRVPKDG